VPQCLSASVPQCLISDQNFGGPNLLSASFLNGSQHTTKNKSDIYG